MGEVYRARDTKLGREAAIKILPEELAADEERVARFEHEAKLLTSLNHPNIAAIYGFEGSPRPERNATRSGVAEREVVGAGPHGTEICALVLELVEGPTLADRIAQGAIAIDEALSIAKQIADALEAGHETGVVHPDLKPTNVKVKDDGTVEVLDYGLAKALEAHWQHCLVARGHPARVHPPDGQPARYLDPDDGWRPRYRAPAGRAGL